MGNGCWLFENRQGGIETSNYNIIERYGRRPKSGSTVMADQRDGLSERCPLCAHVGENWASVGGAVRKGYREGEIWWKKYVTGGGP